MLESVPETNHY